MQCPSCQHENPTAANFCLNCGTKLAKVCPQCQQVLPPEAKFCFACGQALTLTPPAERDTGTRGDGDTGTRTTAPPDSRPPTPDARREAERRQLTVEFIDLVGSTALSAQLDPEELREVVRAYQATCTKVIQRYGGHIAQHLGDGLLVYFGYPAAHEDDAQRAVRTGLEIVGAMQNLNSRLQTTVGATHASPLQVRIGIHTGLVVVGEIGSGDKREILALGETPNIAARLQALAEPDTVVLSSPTQRLVAGLFECQDLGPQTLKGISTPLSVYRVVREGEAQSRFEVAVSKGLTPLVGREEELALLQRRWEQTKVGEGQVVLLSGEPGIGKSRLVQTLKERVSAEGATRIEFRCSAYHQHSAFYPVIEFLQRALGFERGDSPEEKLRKLEVGAHGQWKSQAEAVPLQPDTIPLLAGLLSLPHPNGAPPITLSPQKQKQKTQEALVAWIVEETEKAAVCCAWEDLHWADPSTLEILSLFLDQAPTTRLLTLLTFRPDFTPPWRPRAHFTQLILNRLGWPQVEAMVEQVTGGKALPADILQQIVTKTDGVPLFVEELTKMVVESGLVREANGHYELTGPLPPLAIPATLQDSLMARLDRLAPVKEVVQLGATLGREFSYELIQAVSPLDEETLQQGLAQLVGAELVYQRGLPPQAQYVFKHALIQDAAYQSLLKSTRQQYHKQIAQVLEERFAETREIHPELLAHHYTEAGLSEQAIVYWQRAGERATQRSAYVEATGHLTTALELLKTLPDTPERTQQELDLQTAFGPVLMAVKGYAALEVEHAYARALELCRQVGETPRLLQVLSGLETFYFTRGELHTACELGEQCLSLAQRIQNPLRLLQARLALGAVLFLLGELPLAREHLEQGIALYDPQQQSSHRTLQDPRVDCLSYAALALWCLGYPDQALKRSHEAITLAQELSRPLSLVVALIFATWLHQFRRERQAVLERAERAIILSTEQEFPLWLAYGAIFRGWALAEQAQGEQGIAQIHRGLATSRATGAEIVRPWFLAMLVEAHKQVGQIAEGLTAVAEALVAVDKSGERMCEAELYRLKGELSLKSRQVRSPESEAEECFLKAIEIARHQQAKSLELRAVMSLSRLWQQQGKKDEARQMLAEIYGWFTEGFDTKDLQEAKVLLEELSH